MLVTRYCNDRIQAYVSVAHWHSARWAWVQSADTAE